MFNDKAFAEGADEVLKDVDPSNPLEVRIDGALTPKLLAKIGIFM